MCIGIRREERSGSESVENPITLVEALQKRITYIRGFACRIFDSNWADRGGFHVDAYASS
jgi:hypothetical protein